MASERRATHHDVSHRMPALLQAFDISNVICHVVHRAHLSSHANRKHTLQKPTTTLKRKRKKKNCTHLYHSRQHHPRAVVDRPACASRSELQRPLRRLRVVPGPRERAPASRVARVERGEQRVCVELADDEVEGEVPEGVWEGRELPFFVCVRERMVRRRGREGDVRG